MYEKNLKFSEHKILKTTANETSLIWLLIMVFARFLLAVAVQFATALLFFQWNESPLLSAGAWWPVYGTFIDLGCFILLKIRMKNEGLKFGDLILLDGSSLGKDLLLGLLYVLWFFPLAMTGIMVSSLWVFGSIEPPAVYSPLPAVAAVYSLVIFPAVWALMEQSTYQGYALPRLVQRLPRREMAVIIVAFGWSLQHIALPLVFDGRFMLFRFLSFIPLAVVNVLVFLRTRRLIPLIVAHWLVDMAGILTGIVIPILNNS